MNQPIDDTRPERRDAAENRQRILNTAMKLFAEHGVEAVSMNQIAAETRIGAGTLYRRYRNKSELCMDMLKDSKSLLLTDITASLKANEAQQASVRLQGLLSLFIQFKENYAQLIAGMESSSSQTDSFSRTPSPLYLEIHELLTGLIEEMAAANGHSRADSLFKADMLMTALSSDSYLFQRKVRGLSSAAILDQLCRTFIVLNQQSRL